MSHTTHIGNGIYLPWLQQTLLWALTHHACSPHWYWHFHIIGAADFGTYHILLKQTLSKGIYESYNTHWYWHPPPMIAGLYAQPLTFPMVYSHLEVLLLVQYLTILLINPTLYVPLLKTLDL